MDNILGSLSEMLGGVDFSNLLSSFMEIAKKAIELLKPILSNFISGLGDSTTDPSTTSTAA